MFFFHRTVFLRRDIVMIDDDTYEALNIVHARNHPSLFKCGDAASKKQSGSLFMLLNRCQSQPGIQFLWQVIVTLCVIVTLLFYDFCIYYT